MKPGQQLTPTLRLVRPLGRGAVGQVWVAEHLGLGTKVAVKIITPRAADDPELVERFRREGPAQARIKSPHVAEVLEHGATDGGALYIVMELLKGETLKARLDRLGTLPPAELALLVGHAARGLSRAHELGIVHRDIKPENLFVMDAGGAPLLKVLDFGTAKGGAPGAGSGLTVTGAVLGTPVYMSPEQFASAKQVDHRADSWALAVVAYRALTGQLPFNGDSLPALAFSISRGAFTPPSRHRPELSPEVDEWAARALRLDPDGRFGSIREMAGALSRALGQAGVSAA